MSPKSYQNLRADIQLCCREYKSERKRKRKRIYIFVSLCCTFQCSAVAVISWLQWLISDETWITSNCSYNRVYKICIFFFKFRFWVGGCSPASPPAPTPWLRNTPTSTQSGWPRVIVREFYNIMLTDLRTTLLQGHIRVTAAVGLKVVMQ